MRKLWDETAWQDFQKWKQDNQTIAERIEKLIADIERDYFRGLGKPEPLKENLQGYWSRRITGEHRLVYEVSGNVLYIYSCRGHYKNLT